MWDNDIYNAKYFLVNALLCDMTTSFLYRDYLFFAADCDLRVMPHLPPLLFWKYESALISVVCFVLQKFWYVLCG